MVSLTHCSPHVISSNQLWAGVVSTGPSGCVLNSRYRNRDVPEYKQELGNAIVNFSRVVPDGLRVFFPSYYLMDRCITFWKDGGHRHSMKIWERISKLKKPVIEPKDPPLFPAAMPLWEGAAAMFRDLLISCDKTQSVMVVTTVNPNIFGGNLCLNSTPATKFYFDTNLPAIREFTASLQMNGVGGQQNRHLLKSLLGKNKFSKYSSSNNQAPVVEGEYGEAAASASNIAAAGGDEPNPSGFGANENSHNRTRD
ncbi:unnamed protein product [Brassica oleracea]